MLRLKLKNDYRAALPWALAALVVALGVALALLPLELAALLLIAPLAAALALLDPAWALGLAVLSVPVQELVALPGGLSVTQAAFGLALGSLALSILASPGRPLVLGRLFPPLAIFVWALALSAALTPLSRVEAIRETVRWATVPVVYVLALRAVEGRPWRLWLLLGCLLLAPASNALLGLGQWYLGIGPDSFAIGGGRVRAYGTIGQPNSFAGYMNQGWPLAAGIALSALLGLLAGAPRRPALVALLGAGAAAGLMLAGLLTSFSRGGWVGGMAGGVAVVAALATGLPQALRPLVRRLLLAGAAGVLALALLGGGGLLPGAVSGRFASLVGNLRLFDARGVEINPANFAVVERMAHIQAGWNMLRSRPLVGVGPGNYSVAYERYPGPGERPTNVRPWYESRGHAHNYYLHIAAEAGLIGLAAYLLLVGAAALQAVRALRAARGWLWRGIAAGGIGVVAAVAAHNLFENLHVLNMGIQLGAVWALLVAVERAQEEGRSI